MRANTWGGCAVSESTPRDKRRHACSWARKIFYAKRSYSRCVLIEVNHDKTREGLKSDNMESACGAGIVTFTARKRRALGDGVDKAGREVQVFANAKPLTVSLGEVTPATNSRYLHHRSLPYLSAIATCSRRSACHGHALFSIAHLLNNPANPPAEPSAPPATMRIAMFPSPSNPASAGHTSGTPAYSPSASQLA